jgi:hypothetical protein
MQPIKTEYYECLCHSTDHTLRVGYDPDEGDLWLEIHLRHDSWYKRIWHAIKHVFGYKCVYGCFDCWLMDEKDIDSFVSLMNKKKEFHIQEKLKQLRIQAAEYQE